MAIPLIPILLLLMLVALCIFKLRGTARTVSLTMLVIMVAVLVLLSQPPTSNTVVARMLMPPGVTTTLDGSEVSELALTGDTIAGTSLPNTVGASVETVTKHYFPDARLVEHTALSGPSGPLGLHGWACLLENPDESVDSVLVVLWFDPAQDNAPPQVVVLRCRSGEASHIKAASYRQSVRRNLVRRVIAGEQDSDVTIALEVDVEKRP